MDDPQRCIRCDYDLTGLGPMGQLVACPECGTENRMGEIPLEHRVRPVPSWWALAVSLGWPGVAVGALGVIAVFAGDPMFLRGVLNLGLLALGVALVRSVLLTLDYARPGRRLRLLPWIAWWALAGTGAIVVASFLVMLFSAWFAGEIIQAM